MPETLESSGNQLDPESETTKMMIHHNPRVEIDTSPPFGSVKEAVTHFGGSGSWIPLHVLRLAAAGQGVEEYDMDKVEKQAAELENDLIVKEHETLEVLKELEEAKRIVEGLKLNLMKEVSALMENMDTSSDSGMSTPNEKSVGNLSFFPSPPRGIILTELNEAKLNLSKTTNDLAVIRASVESLNKKVKKEKTLLGKGNERQMHNPAGVLSAKQNHDGEAKACVENPIDMSRRPQRLNFEAEQFRKMEEAARYEVMKATSEIEQTKTSIEMVEMRLIAAKKMEAAARAMEAVALAERKAPPKTECSSEVFQQKAGVITLTYEEYSVLTQKAQKAEELSKNEVAKPSLGAAVAMGEVDDINRRKIAAEEIFCQGRSEHGHLRTSAHDYTNFKFRNNSHTDSHPLDENESNLFKDKSMPVLRSSISIGDILSRKLILQDEIVAGKHADCHTERREASLSQMLREQSGLIFNSTKSVKEGSGEKQFFTQRKKFGFIHVSLPLTKQSKKKNTTLNPR